jgi:predicted nucleotidyltransferase
VIEAPFEVGRMLGRLNDAGLPYVVVGGIAVIVHGYVRPTEDLDALVPRRSQVGEELRVLLTEWGATRLDGSALPDALFDGEHNVRAHTPDGVIDFIPEGEPPLDFEGVHRTARSVEIDGVETRVCDLAHLAAFKRLAGRMRDRADLAELEAAHGDLPDPR